MILRGNFYQTPCRFSHLLVDNPEPRGEDRHEPVLERVSHLKCLSLQREEVLAHVEEVAKRKAHLEEVQGQETVRTGRKAKMEVSQYKSFYYRRIS